MVEINPPPSFHEIRPARQPRAGPSMRFSVGKRDRCVQRLRQDEADALPRTALRVCPKLGETVAGSAELRPDGVEQPGILARAPSLGHHDMAPRIAHARPHRPAARALLGLALAALGAPAFAQRGLPADNPGDGGVVQAPVLDVANVVDGQVMDLSRDLVGRMLYCTSQGDVGRIVPGGSKTLLATAASGPFPNPLRAVAVTPAGDVVVVDSQGHVRKLVGATAPLVYIDEWMIQDATDLLVDSRGSFIIASATPPRVARTHSAVARDRTRGALRSGRSRMAATMFSRETRQALKSTVRKVTIMPRQ